MRTNKFAILAGSVLAATPLVGKAVTVTFTYDTNDISFSASAVAGSGTGTFNSATDTMTVTPGTIISLGVDEEVDGNPNSTLAYHGTYDSVTGSHHYLQPANLGIAAFGIGFNTSSQTIAPFDAADAGGVGVNGDFSTVSLTGSFDPNNNVAIGSIAGGVGSPNVNVISTSGAAQLAYGAGTPAELFNSLMIDAGSGGTATVTATGLATNNLAVIEYNSGGTSTTSKPVYKNVSLTGTDTINQLPALTIVVLGATTTSASHHAIISLTSGSTPVSTYGPADGSLTLVGHGGSYNVAVANPFTTAAIGSVAVTGFVPSTDTEIYALKLASGGVPLTPAQDAVVVADINGLAGVTNASTGVTASLVPATGPLATLFGSYSILLTAPGITNPAELGFDFTADAEADPAAPAGITVTGVAAVPEPATAAGIVFGAAGLLLGRRKNKAIVA